ncbi:Fic family protein [Mucilaginibacter sp. ZT4R22]|uniref:Fic family protein n=1 Tax=Mucilaginibacter pankratovii TaxID=2772110 RepID=A0ABR7WPB0_9SPHI|nr:Fic family protein [Mucilaginibacter pankratovii]MBD1364154.1 Fic family protein [Mucilaginibacter pankratovii]
MDHKTSWTPSPDDNLKGLTDKNAINEIEARGIAAAELFILQMDTDIVISTSLILEVHKIGFSELYEWAGKWRTTEVLVGQLNPPAPPQILQLLYQFIDNLNYKLDTFIAADDHVDNLVYAHYEFIRIHPFNNGNGRTGRLLMNLVALKLGYQPLQLYHREGESRRVYIDAMKSADKGDFEPLRNLIAKELLPF